MHCDNGSWSHALEETGDGTGAPPPSLGYAGQVSEPIPGEPTKQNISHYQASVRHVSWEIRGERKGEKDQALEEKGDKH